MSLRGESVTRRLPRVLNLTIDTWNEDLKLRRGENDPTVCFGGHEAEVWRADGAEGKREEREGKGKGRTGT